MQVTAGTRGANGCAAWYAWPVGHTHASAIRRAAPHVFVFTLLLCACPGPAADAPPVQPGAPPASSPRPSPKADRPSPVEPAPVFPPESRERAKQAYCERKKFYEEYLRNNPSARNVGRIRQILDSEEMRDCP